ncbi:MAG TPA: DUF4124 domain-containing protein [Erythrobacter sp.]|jgi:hypothetical protein|nr:DUF4124 domain-containing protein [Erythrobacter sp.]
MIRLIAMSIAALVSGPLAAQAYKWVDERGVTNYGEKPPANRPSRSVDTQPGGTLESGSLQQKKFEADLRGSVSVAPAPVPAVAAAEVPARGMGFDTYIRLQRGMSEGELILRAGKPDHESVENFRHDIVKSYYYYPTLSDPFITVVTVRGGRIANIERTRKAY